MFIAAKKIWKQPKCPSTKEQTEVGIYLKWNITQPQKGNSAICDNRDEHTGHYARNKADTEGKYFMIDHLSGT